MRTNKHDVMRTKQTTTINNVYKQTDIMKLTAHFTLSEFTRSAIAETHGIDNTIPVTYIPTVKQLCDTILEPLRAFAGQPITISSGYRCNALNIKAGGVYASQHTLGEAADIALPKTEYTSWEDNQRHTDMETAHRWFNFLKEHTDFDQLILETANGKDYWIHVSCRKNRKKNRHQVLTLKVKS